MAKKRRRAKKLTQTQKYNRKLTGIEYLADISEAVSALYEQSGLGKRKRATKKQLKEAEKLYKESREVLRAQGFEDIPSLTTILKHLEFKQEQLHQAEDSIIEAAIVEEQGEYIPVIEIGKEFVDNFRQHITNTFEDSLAVAEQEYGAEAAGYFRRQSESFYLEAMTKLDAVIQTANYDYELVARSIKAQPDYDVYLSTEYVRASDLGGYMELCVQFFDAVLSDIQKKLNS